MKIHDCFLCPLLPRTESPIGAIQKPHAKQKQNKYLKETRSTGTKKFKEARQPGAERTVYVSTGLPKLTQKFAGQRASELAPMVERGPPCESRTLFFNMPL